MLKKVLAGCAIVYAAFGCEVNPIPVTTGPHGDITDDPVNGEQAEVTLTTGNYFGTETVVAGFNDFSLDSHFTYMPSATNPLHRVLTRGVSVMG